MSRLDFRTGNPRLVANLPPQAVTNPLDIAADGTWFIYSQFDESDADLMLVENFR